MPLWFCGKRSAWHFFAAPLNPTRCYFTSTISQDALEQKGLVVWQDKHQCDCTPAPPPPASPPAAIYFCGQQEVWHLFDYQVSPTKCYYSSTISRIDVMRLGVDVYRDEDACRCQRPPPPPPPPLAPLTPPPDEEPAEAGSGVSAKPEPLLTTASLAAPREAAPSLPWLIEANATVELPAAASLVAERGSREARALASPVGAFALALGAAVLASVFLARFRVRRVGRRHATSMV